MMRSWLAEVSLQYFNWICLDFSRISQMIEFWSRHFKNRKLQILLHFGEGLWSCTVCLDHDWERSLKHAQDDVDNIVELYGLDQI